MTKMIATREGFGDGIIEIAKENPNIFVVDCDISSGTKTGPFAEKFPDRYVNVGIAEQNGAGFAAGLATTGKIPFVSTYATFGSMRMCEQIRTSICYANLNVKIACSHGGLTPANDGPTHQAVEDIGIMRSIPNMTVLMPGDYFATKALVRAAAEYNGPVYLRFTRDAIPVIYDENDKFEIGKGKVLKEGKDITFIAIGDMISQALEASEILEKKGISVEVIDMYSLKPIDKDLILKSISKTGKIVTVEDHNIINGLGSAVADIVAENKEGIMRKVALLDTFGESGPYYDLIKKYKIDSKTVVEKAEELLKG